MAALKLNLPRKLSRLPRIGRPKNPFKAGTSNTGKRVKRALAAHTAALAANQIPGKAVAAGAIGAKLGGAGGAAAAFSATEAASVAASALLARSVARRGKAAAYLSRRSKRKTGVYKAMVEALEAVAKAGLITPGKRPLLHRVGFLLRAGKSDRHASIGRYLESRKRGLGYGPKGKRRRRTGTYTGVYATGVNKASEHDMDAIDGLYDAIEKAARRGGPRSGLIPYGSSHQRKRAEFFSARASRRGVKLTPRQARAKSYLGELYRGGKGPGGAPRKAFYKSEAIEALDGAIEKASGKGMLSRTGPRLRSVKRVLRGESKSRGAAAKDYKEYRAFREPRVKNKVWGYPAFMQNMPSGAKRYRSAEAKRWAKRKGAGDRY